MRQNWVRQEYVGGESADHRQPEEQVAEEEEDDQRYHQSQSHRDVAVEEFIDLGLQLVDEVVEEVSDVDEEHGVSVNGEYLFRALRLQT